MQFGLMTLSDHLPDPHSGAFLTDQAARYRSFVDQAVLAEQVGFDMVNVGEHHFCDYIVSAPPVLLAAIAERTTTLRLSTAVTLAANLDPIRIAEDYATLDVLSNGRVEVVLGRGALVDAYEVFGYPLERSREVFEESVRLLVRVWSEEGVSCDATFRPALRDITVQPRPIQRPHPPIWIGAGSSEHTFDLAAELGLHLMIPTVFGPASAFLPMVERYRERYAAAGHDPAGLKVGTCTHTFVAEDSQDAKALWYPYYDSYLTWLERLQMSRPGSPVLPFRAKDLIDGPAMCGSPAQVIDCMGRLEEEVGMELHLAMFDLGGLPEDSLRRSIELYGEHVLPEFAKA
ncbi:MAG: LLM class flavin-dependent oxidoreductase [Planctomycetota bacterium]|jgi:alkanesulfonate monooxygenase SsuD/methylene tetrahydromethanopterin reductase-like flavin-dependent oxidoreductase (luciferase family)